MPNTYGRETLFLNEAEVEDNLMHTKKVSYELRE